METTNASYSSRRKFFAFITVGLLVAAATGILVWKTSSPSGSSSADAGPMIVSKTPNVVNASDEVNTTTQETHTTSSTAGTNRSSGRHSLREQHTNDPLLPPNAFVGNQSTSVYSGGRSGGSVAAPATGIQETAAAEGMVLETAEATEVLASPATSATPRRTQPRTQEINTPSFTTQPTHTAPTTAEPTPAPVEQPSDEPSAPITTVEPRDSDGDGAPVPDSSTTETTSESAITDVVEEDNAPLIPPAESVQSSPVELTTEMSLEPTA